MSARVLRVRHPLYGIGWWQYISEPGRAWVNFDGTDAYPAGARCVPIVALSPVTLRESAAENDRQIGDMLGHDVRAVEQCLRETRS